MHSNYGNYAIDTFPDPIPKEIDGVLHYTESVDPQEKYIPSILENVEKSPHGIPFIPTAQTVKNVGFCHNVFRMSKKEIVTFKTQDKERRFIICQADDEEGLLCVWCSTFRIYSIEN